MKKSSFSLKNKISFILGGSGLIGRTVCLEFAKAGSVVCLIDKETSSSLKLLEELKKINSKCSFFQLDCSDFEQLEDNFNDLGCGDGDTYGNRTFTSGGEDQSLDTVCFSSCF